MPSRLQRLRPWLALLAAAGVAGVLLPPAATAAGRYVFAQALQFAVLAVAAPALLVIGAPWRLRASVRRSSAGPAGAGAGAGVEGRPAGLSRAGLSLADQVAIARSHRPGVLRAWAVLVGYLAVVVIWRLPVVVNALARNPALALAEAATLIVAGCALWLELVESPPMLPRISRPQRAAFAALPMWSIWALAYIMGFSRGAWFAAYAHQPGHGLGTAADQQIAAAILWAVPAVCFVPVVFTAMMSWLRDSADPDAELREVPAARGEGQPAAPRPPRGWRMPST